MHLTIIPVLAVTWCFSLVLNLQPRSPLKFDEFGSISCAEERARVDNYGRALQAQEQSQGIAVVVVYAGREDTRSGEVLARLFGIRDRLRSESSIDQDRIVIMDGGVRERLLVQFWIVPADSREAARVLVHSEIPSKDVRLKLPRMEKRKYECTGAH